MDVLSPFEEESQRLHKLLDYSHPKTTNKTISNPPSPLYYHRSETDMAKALPIVNLRLFCAARAEMEAPIVVFEEAGCGAR